MTWIVFCSKRDATTFLDVTNVAPDGVRVVRVKEKVVTGFASD
jgi:hypothetical protein